jgi:hypothetical protein
MPPTRTSSHFEWTRFWLPRAEPLDLSGGFLPDPEDDFGRFNNPALRTLDSFGETPVLVLLGDPGMGKTTTLADESQRLNDVGLDFSPLRSRFSVGGSSAFWLTATALFATCPCLIRP